jgi:hypothetical protein
MAVLTDAVAGGGVGCIVVGLVAVSFKGALNRRTVGAGGEGGAISGFCVSAGNCAGGASGAWCSRLGVRQRLRGPGSSNDSAWGESDSVENGLRNDVAGRAARGLWVERFAGADWT